MIAIYSALKNGYIAEEKFVLECMEKDITVSKPISNTEPYDFIVENKNGKLLKIQVKKAWIDKKGRKIASLKSSYPRSKIRKVASKSERVDYICVYSDDGWYNIPRKEVEHIASNIADSKTGEYAKYLNKFAF